MHPVTISRRRGEGLRIASSHAWARALIAGMQASATKTARSVTWRAEYQRRGSQASQSATPAAPNAARIASWKMAFVGERGSSRSAAVGRELDGDVRTAVGPMIYFAADFTSSLRRASTLPLI